MCVESLATQADCDQLKALWKTAFGDDEEDINAFFDCFFDGTSCLVVKKEDCIVSMLFLLETAIVTAGERRSVGYIYAGATLPSEQGKGHYRRLLSFAKDEAKRRGLSALLLRPATPQLATSYERMGFVVPLFCDERSVDIGSPTSEKQLTAQEFVTMRRRLLAEQRQSFVDWDERVISYALRWCCAVSCSPSSCALYAVDDDGIRVWDAVGCTPFIGANSTAYYCRTAGATTLTALLCPVDPAVCEAAWNTVYFGYGLE